MVSNHWRVYQHDLNCGEPKATNDDTTLSCGQLIPASYHTDIDDTHMYFNSPCGELSQSVNLMPTSNNILPQSETSATTSSNANTLCITKPDNLQPIMQPTLPTTCKNIPVTHLPLTLSKSLNGVVTSCVKAYCPDVIQSLPRPFRLANMQAIINPIDPYFLDGILQLHDSIQHDHEHQIKSEYFPSIEPEPPPYATQQSLHTLNWCNLYGVQSSASYIAQTYYEMFTFTFFISHRDSVLIHPHTTELIMDQLDLQNSHRSEWGVIYIDTSTPSTTIRSEVTDRHLCSMGSDRNYSNFL